MIPRSMGGGIQFLDRTPVDSSTTCGYYCAVKKIIQVHIFRSETHFVAECIDLPVVTQAKTLDELAHNVREAIALHLEGENLAELGLVDDPSILASVELEPLAHAQA